MRLRRGSKDQVYAITSAPRALAEDVHDRTVRYLVSMGIRTGCLFLLFIVPGWWKWVCVAGAVLLPLLAVMVANAGRERPDEADSLLTDEPGAPLIGPERQLGSGYEIHDDRTPHHLPYDPRTEYLR